MTSDRRLAVYDCNVLLGAILSNKGSAFQCMQLVDAGKVQLFVSPFSVQELRETANHPDLKCFRELTQERVDVFILDLLTKATLLDNIPEVFQYPRDPEDAHYVNLALVARASCIVSRDNDLLDLMNPTNPAGADFKRRFPQLRILQPIELLREVGAWPP